MSQSLTATVELARVATARGVSAANTSARHGYVAARTEASRASAAIVDGASDAAEWARGNAAALGAVLAQPELLRWSEALTQSAATIYDKALDAEYLRTHIGGGNHRMFDGGHDLLGAWERVQRASDTDTFNQEVVGYASALWKDVTTVKGLPFMTWDKTEYDQVAVALSGVPGVDKTWVYDLFSYDVFEVFSAGLGAAGILFALNHDDLEKLSELLGTMGVVGVISANPIMGLVMIVTTGFAFAKAEERTSTLRRMVPGLGKGATLAILGTTLSSALALPVLIKLALVISATQLARRHVLENGELHRALAGAIAGARVQAKTVTAELLVSSTASDRTDGFEPA